MVSFILYFVSSYIIEQTLQVIAADQLPDNSHAYEKFFLLDRLVHGLADLLTYSSFSMIFAKQGKCTLSNCYQGVFFSCCVIRLIASIFLLLMQNKLRHVEVDKNILTRAKEVILFAFQKRIHSRVIAGEEFDKWNFEKDAMTKYDKKDVSVAKVLCIHWPLFIIYFAITLLYFSSLQILQIDMKAVSIPFKSGSFFRLVFQDAYFFRSIAIFLIASMLVILRPVMKARNILPTFLLRLVFLNIILSGGTLYAINLNSIIEYRLWTPEVPKGYSAFYYLNLGPCDIVVIGKKPRIQYQPATVAKERQSY